MKRVVEILRANALILMGTGLLVGCNKNKGGETEPEQTPYAIQEMLTNYVDNLIVPEYTVLAEKMTALRASTAQFTSTLDSTEIPGIRAELKALYTQWQTCSAYEFGPAMEVGLRSAFNTYPTNTDKIESNISAQNLNLDAIANLTAIGLPAIEYLLYGTDTSYSAVVSRFANDTNRSTYLNALCDQLNSKLTHTVSGWSTYQSTFKASTGSDAGSSLSLLINQMNFDYELIKNAEIGIPLGKKTLGITYPSSCQAYYAGYSAMLSKEHLNAIFRLYKGESMDGTNGKGIDDYLIHVGAKHGNGSLNDAIQAQFEVCLTKVSAIQTPISIAVDQDAATVDAAYAEIQKLLVMLKTDTPSALSVLITYQDNDGD